MSLIKCPECGRQNVSDKARTCPNCGFPIRKYFENSQTSSFMTSDIEHFIPATPEMAEPDINTSNVSSEDSDDDNKTLASNSDWKERSKKRRKRQRRNQIIAWTVIVGLIVTLVFCVVLVIIKKHNKTIFQDGISTNTTATDSINPATESNNTGVKLVCNYTLSNTDNDTNLITVFSAAPVFHISSARDLNIDILFKYLVDNGNGNSDEINVHMDKDSKLNRALKINCSNPSNYDYSVTTEQLIYIAVKDHNTGEELASKLVAVSYYGDPLPDDFVPEDVSFDDFTPGNTKSQKEIDESSAMTYFEIDEKLQGEWIGYSGNYRNTVTFDNNWFTFDDMYGGHAEGSYDIDGGKQRITFNVYESSSYSSPPIMVIDTSSGSMNLIGGGVRYARLR